MRWSRHFMIVYRFIAAGWCIIPTGVFRTIRFTLQSPGRTGAAPRGTGNCVTRYRIP
jgi:hypothetical protein